jgi:predicted nuclease with TOPRIM domain
MGKQDSGTARGEIIGATIKRLEVGLPSLRDEMTGLRVDLMARLDDHRALLEQMQADITAIRSNAEQVDAQVRAIQDEQGLSEDIINGLVRSMRRLESRISTLEEKKLMVPHLDTLNLEHWRLADYPTVAGHHSRCAGRDDPGRRGDVGAGNHAELEGPST